MCVRLLQPDARVPRGKRHHRGVNVDLGYRPDLDAGRLRAILEHGFGDRYEVYDPGRFQVPDVMVKRSDSEGAAVQIVQRRLRKRTRLRVFALAPSIARREWRPAGMAQQKGELEPLVTEVARFLEQSEELRRA